ncbi:MAG TPA: hypothetical protein VFJ82_05095 [Longimicrobium sp.]|nr:hypothetical protein [Longimicrobium sp.]
MSHDFLNDLKIFGATPSASPASLADPGCPECVTFVAGPASGAAQGDGAWVGEDGGDPSLARLLAPNALLRVAWPALADPGPAPDPDDADAMEEYARHVAIARFARRVLEGDPHAWVEALASYRERMRLPVPVRSTIRPDGGGSLRVGIELPPPDAVPIRRGETRTAVRARYDDLCSGILLAFACDAFRVLPPDADSLYLVGYRRETDPATGHPRHAILMRLATDRASVEALDLSRATPSAAFEYLGGAARKARGELVALAYEMEFARVL